MLIQVITLLPLSAALLSGYLVLVAVTAPHRRGPLTVLFVALNSAIVLWSSMYFLQLNMPNSIEPSIASAGSPEFFIFVLLTLGVAGAPTYWFLFAAAYARKHFWTQGIGLFLAHVPLVYTLLVAVTNPWHRLFVKSASEAGGFTYGPLALPHQIMTLVLVGTGIWLLVAALLRQRSAWAKWQAAMVAGACFVQLLGGVLWSTRDSTGIPLTINPTPILFAFLSLLLAYLVLKGGLADIVPIAALQALRTMSDAVIILDENGMVAIHNPAADVLFPKLESGAFVCEALSELCEAIGDPVELESDHVEIELPLGRATYWTRVRRTRGRHNLPIGHTVLLSDITELRTARMELAELNERLGLHVIALEKAQAESQQRSAALEEANHQLREATQAKSRFLANMSHELRTPLNSIIGFTGTMLQGMTGQLNEEQVRQLGMVNDSGKHLLRLINDILDLAKIEAGTQQISTEPVRIDELVRSATAKAEPLVFQKGLELRVLLLDDLPVIVTDRLRAEQVLLNLLGNAVKFTERGTITLSVAVRERFIEIAISDTGIGIPKDKLGRVFEPFEQVVHDVGGKPNGTGLGLSISRDLAIALGGSLRAESVVGQGSQFTLLLPLSGRLID